MARNPVWSATVAVETGLFSSFCRTRIAERIDVALWPAEFFERVMSPVLLKTISLVRRRFGLQPDEFSFSIAGSSGTRNWTRAHLGVRPAASYATRVFIAGFGSRSRTPANTDAWLLRKHLAQRTGRRKRNGRRYFSTKLRRRERNPS